MKNCIPLFMLLLLVGCQKTGELTYVEKRVVGSWFYTDVDFTPRWGFKKDITKDYFGQVLTFNDDFSFSLENTEDGTFYEGVWQLNQVSDNGSNNNDNQWADQIVVSYQVTGTGEIVQQIWDHFCVSKNRINADNSDKDGHYQFELKRL